MHITKWSLRPIFIGPLKQPFLGCFRRPLKTAVLAAFAASCQSAAHLIRWTNRLCRNGPNPSQKAKRLCDTLVFIYGPYQIPSTEGGGRAPGTCPHQPPKNVSRARFGHVLYVIQHRFVRYNKRLIMTSGRRGNGGSKTRLQNGVFLEDLKMAIFGAWVFEVEWVRRHRLWSWVGSWCCTKFGVQKCTRKRGKLGTSKKGVFGGVGGEEKFGQVDLCKCIDRLIKL